MKLRLFNLVALSMLLEGCIILYFVYCSSLLIRGAHASWPQVLTALGGILLNGLFFVAAAALYWRVAQLRLWLRIFVALEAVYGAYFLLTSQSFVQSYWGFFHGDIVAISEVITIGMLVVGILAAADHYSGRSHVSR